MNPRRPRREHELRDDDVGLPPRHNFTGSQAEYSKSRRNQYPDTFGLKNPSPEIAARHNDYSAALGNYERDVHEYNQRKNEEDKQYANYFAKPPAGPRAEKSFYDGHRAGLFPHQHENLREPAKNFFESSKRHATKRNEFLSDFPASGHPTLQSRKQHEAHRNLAYAETKRAGAAYEQHHAYSGYDQVEGREGEKDEYGRPLPGHRPSHDPYSRRYD
ncbi:hypothetical protein FQN57_006938 [Myotisia sp. PD_48]|nr:hypothetical protein FQN57_006938 [Myotisia sp. PD_48]